jgi:hypothetical protein
MNEELKQSVDLMLSEDYKERLVAEHMQLKSRIEGLNDFLTKWNDGNLDFTPKSFMSVFESQLNAMRQYFEALERRLKDEGLKA